MVEDSIAKKFSSSSVSIAGVDVIGSADSDFVNYLAATGITFPLVKDGGTIWNTYFVDCIGMVVIDQEGVIRFLQKFELETDTAKNYAMMSEVVRTVRGLIENRIIRTGATAKVACRGSNSPPRFFTLSGKTIAHPETSVRSGFIVRSLDGRVTGIARFARPSP
jgi:hypothetical protein